MTNAVSGATTRFLLVFVTSAVAYRSRRFARVVQAQPTVLVRHGQLIAEHLDRERISVHDIFSAMHKVGLLRLDQLEWGILEGDGKSALVPSQEARDSAHSTGGSIAAAAKNASLTGR